MLMGIILGLAFAWMRATNAAWHDHSEGLPLYLSLMICAAPIIVMIETPAQLTMVDVWEFLGSFFVARTGGDALARMMRG